MSNTDLILNAQNLIDLSSITETSDVFLNIVQNGGNYQEGGLFGIPGTKGGGLSKKLLSVSCFTILFTISFLSWLIGSKRMCK
jgi:hypothetical protein